MIVEGYVLHRRRWRHHAVPAIFDYVHYFMAVTWVCMIGLGICLSNYGLFIVSQFPRRDRRGYDTRTAVRRTVIHRQTHGNVLGSVDRRVGDRLRCSCRRVSAKSLTYATIASVMLSAILSITVFARRNNGILGKENTSTRSACGPQGALPGELEDFGLNWLLRPPQRTQDPRGSKPASGASWLTG